MTVPRDTDRLIRAFLDEGRDELPDRAYDAVRTHIEHTRQRVVIGPWREEQVTRYAIFGIAAAIVVLAVVVGVRFLPSAGGIGGQPTATPSPVDTPRPTATPAATPTPVPSATAVEDPEGRLSAGSIYAAHPFAPPNDGITFTFSVPSDSWEASSDPGRMIGLAWYGESAGVGMGFLRVTSLNGDPCNWSGAADDVEVGPTVDDLVTALTSSDDFETSEPEDVTLGGYSGKKLVVTMPSTLIPGGNTQPDCDEQIYVLWDESNAEGFYIYAQGPENLWTLWILDVEGERVVILRSEFANSAAERRQELDSIVDSIVITAP